MAAEGGGCGGGGGGSGGRNVEILVKGCRLFAIRSTSSGGLT